jgi:hypothetical protein
MLMNSPFVLPGVVTPGTIVPGSKSETAFVYSSSERRQIRCVVDGWHTAFGPPVVVVEPPVVVELLDPAPVVPEPEAPVPAGLPMLPVQPLPTAHRPNIAMENSFRVFTAKVLRVIQRRQRLPDIWPSKKNFAAQKGCIRPSRDAQGAPKMLPG